MRLLEELKKINVDDLLPHNSVEKMSEEDQVDLAHYMTDLGVVFQMIAPLLAEGEEQDSKGDTIITAAMVYGFVLGHNWVRDRWTLW